MFKFLRKYNKLILAVGGTLLMIVFLIPSAITQLSNRQARTGATWATVTTPKTRKVSNGDLQQVRSELLLLQRIQQQWGPLLPGLDALDRPEHWYLLVNEADSAGLVGGAARLAATPGVQQFALATGESVPFISQTLAKLDGVLRMIDLYLDTDKLSDRRLKAEARRLFHGVTAELVILEASEPDPPVAFGDGALLEQMNKYADLAPGEGDMGFGYRLPDRAKIEWLSIPVDQVRDAIASSDKLNQVALRRHWRLNTAPFGEPDPNAAVPETVRNDLLERLTTETLDNIAKYANDQLRVHRRALKQRDGYYTLPEGWQDLSLQDLALDLQEEFSIPLPTYQALGDQWQTPDEMADLEGVGVASTNKFGETPIQLPELVAALREFSGEQTTPIQAGVSGPPMRGEDQSVYVFRVIDADPSRPPNSLDEVRDQVTADLARLRHFGQLVEQSDALRQEALDKGLLNMALGRNTSVRRAGNITLTDLGTLFAAGNLGSSSRQPTALPVIGVDEVTVEAIVDRAMMLDPTIPMDELADAERTFVLPVENSLAVMIVRIARQSPLTSETFSTYAGLGIVQRPILAQEMGDGDEVKQVFGYDALAARYGFKLASGPADDPTEDEDQITPPDA